MNRPLLLRIIAIILVVLFAFGISTSIVSLGWLGLAFFIGSFI